MPDQPAKHSFAGREPQAHHAITPEDLGDRVARLNQQERGYALHWLASSDPATRTARP